MIFGPKPDSYVLPNERRVIRMRPHWASQMKIASQTVIIVAVLCGFMWLLSGVGDSIWVLQTALWSTALIFIIRFAYHVLHWWDDIIIITDRRFIRVRGVFTSKADMMPITKVTDMTYFTSFIGGRLGYGTLRIESAGQMQSLELIEYIPQPEMIYEAIAKLVFGDKDHTSSLPAPKRGRIKKGKRPEPGMTEPLPSTDDLSEEWPDK